jgi:putative ABC transport system substrate-binding protein
MIASGLARGSVEGGPRPSLRVEVSSFNKRDTSEIEWAITAFTALPNGGLILTAGGPTLVNRDLIIALAARHKLPAVYFDRLFVTAGGLLSYGPDRIDLYRRAAGYVDRILKGETPAEMPVQAPTKYQLVINLISACDQSYCKTARALGLAVPQLPLTHRIHDGGGLRVAEVA